MPWLWRVFDRSIKKPVYLEVRPNQNIRAFLCLILPWFRSWNQFFTEISPHEVSGMNIVPMLNPLKFSITTPLNFQNMQSVSMPVQVFWNLELIPIKGNWFSSKHFFAVFAIVLCVSGADLYFGGRLCFSNCQVFKNAFLRIVGYF